MRKFEIVILKYWWADKTTLLIMAEKLLKDILRSFISD